MTEFYIIVVFIIVVILWRGRRRRGRKVLSPAQLGEVLYPSRPTGERSEHDDGRGESAATG